MFKIFLIISILFLNSLANDIKTIEYKGDIDLVLGDFSKSNLDAICGFSYPEIYKIWKKNPTFTSKDIENCSELLKEYSQSLGFYRAKIDYEIKNDIATINIFRNEAIKVSSIKVEDEYKKFLNFKKDEVFISSKFSESKKNIRKYLNENGYAKADINAKAYVNLDEYKVELKEYYNRRGYKDTETFIEFPKSKYWLPLLEEELKLLVLRKEILR